MAAQDMAQGAADFSAPDTTVSVTGSRGGDQGAGAGADPVTRAIIEKAGDGWTVTMQTSRGDSTMNVPDGQMLLQSIGDAFGIAPGGEDSAAPMDAGPAAAGTDQAAIPMEGENPQ